VRNRRRRIVSALLGAVLAGPLALPGTAAAQTADAFVDGAEPWTASDCNGDVPIVAGSDAKAQSDIYSAVTLAGVLDTDCVILAGPRDGDMPANQQARLDAASAGGYIVGGTAAVPAAKAAGRTMTRLAGADRWATAQLVGSEARSLAGGTAPAAPTPDTSLTAPDDVRQPGVHLRGAEPWIASDCVGDDPIVVGSDTKAQSDIYSAITLAGVIGTDCVILAGPRDSGMPASQQARIDAAGKSGFVVGGIAAVPTAKIAGRDMTRFAGTDRWATAQLVGRHASGDPTAGTDTTTEQTTATPALAHATVTAGNGFSCALGNDDNITCWGKKFDAGATGDKGQLDAPSGGFTAISGSGEHSCGLRTDRTVACWGANTDSHDSHVGQADAPLGTFTAIAAAGLHSCGVRTTGTLTCWGRNDDGQANAPAGTYTTVAAGAAHSCGVRADGTVHCWGHNQYGQTRAPGGTFRAVAAGWFHSCGLRLDGSVTCWGHNDDGQTDAPTGTFTAVAAGGIHSCGIRTNGHIACWGENRSANIFSNGQAKAPAGTFTAVDAGGQHSCGMRSNGTVICWGKSFEGETDIPDGLRETMATDSCTAAGAAIDSAEAEMIRLVNDLRARVGVAPLAPNAAVGVVARRWSQTMCETGDFQHNPFFSEQYPVGVSRLPGENIATARGTRQAFDALVDSPGHYANMVRAGFTSIGVGVAIGANGTMWFTQNFSSSPTDNRASTRSTSDTFDAVSVGDSHACGLRTDGAITCWGWVGLGSLGQTNAPSGTFTAIDVGDSRSCGLRNDGTVACWGAYYETGEARVPAGVFAALAVRQLDSCGLRTDGTIACWANGPLSDDVSLPDPPSGTFTQISGGSAFCGLRTDRTIVCWGAERWLTDVPSGTFSAVSAGFPHACGVRTNGTITCWGFGVENWLWDVPSGTFTAVSAGVDRACGLRNNGTIACWGHPADAQSVPSGTFTSVSAGWFDSCALRTDGTITCWGWGPTSFEDWDWGPTSDG